MHVGGVHVVEMCVNLSRIEIYTFIKLNNRFINDSVLVYSML